MKISAKKILFSASFFLIVLSSCTDISFDNQKWKNWDIKESDSHLRWDMVDDLIENYNLEGKTREEIIELLGRPDNEVDSSQENLYYDLGPCRRGIDFGSLNIELKNGMVVKTEKHCN